MQTIQYNFKAIPIVPDSSTLIDIILSKTNRKTPTVVHPGYVITRIRKFYMRKIRFTYNSIDEKIEEIVSGFPKLEDIHPFYSDLINILYDKDHFKMALGYINTGKNLCEKVSKDYVKLMKYADSLYRCKQLKIAALGRMATILKKLNNSLKYLEEVRKHLGRLPSIDPYTRTLLLTGFPNVGKSSFMNKITNAESEVQPYPFTTQSLWAGHTYYKNLKWQVIDTPGILDRPLEDRNTIEMQAITALAHLDAVVLYFIDISEECGYSVTEQVNLFNSIKPLFKNKPLVLILNKIDVLPYENLSDEYKKILTNAAQENNTYMIKMSNISNVGVVDVKSKSCDILLEYRKVNVTKSLKPNSKDILDNKIYVAQPNKRDNKERKPLIPDSVIQERKNREKSVKKVETEQDFDKTLKYGEESLINRSVSKNRIKELMDQKGGDGVFYVPDRDHFILENPDWNDDVWPEIMDGKNVFDFVDKDIKQKLEKLIKEEEALEQKAKETGNYMEVEEEDNDDIDDLRDSDLDEELLVEHDKMMENQKKIRVMHKSVKASQLPRKIRDMTLTEEFMNNLRYDKKEDVNKLREISTSRRNEEKEKTKRSLLRQTRLKAEDFSDSDDDVDMDMDDEKRMKRDEKIKKQKEEIMKKEVAQRMMDKIQKKFNREGIINETDRRVGTKLPIHLNTGKRGIGKTDRR